MMIWSVDKSSDIKFIRVPMRYRPLAKNPKFSSTKRLLEIHALKVFLMLHDCQKNDLKVPMHLTGMSQVGKIRKVRKKSVKNKAVRKFRENGSKVSEIFFFDLNILKTVLWFWSRRRADKQGHYYSQTPFGVRRVDRRKNDPIWSGRVRKKVRKFQKIRSCDNAARKRTNIDIRKNNIYQSSKFIKDFFKIEVYSRISTLCLSFWWTYGSTKQKKRTEVQKANSC